MLPMIYMSVIDDDDVPDFEEIYKKCRDKAYMTAFDILRDHTLAEDCVSEVFLAAARNFKKIHNLKSYETVRYIVISSRNRALDIAAKENRSKTAELTEEDEYIDDTALSDIDLVLWKELIRSLAPTDRDILYLHLIKGYDYKDISSMLGISTAAAKQRFWEAKKKLIRMLKEGEE